MTQTPPPPRRKSLLDRIIRVALSPIIGLFERLAGWVLSFSRPMRAALVAVLVTTGMTALWLGTEVITRFEQGLSDWRFFLAGEKIDAAHPEIALLLIREESLADKPAYSPIDRGVLAELVGKIDQYAPAVIGLDFVFDKQTQQDPALIAAIRAAQAPVVIGLFEERGDTDDSLSEYWALAQKTQEQFIAQTGARFGYLNVKTEVDGVVRRRAAPIGENGPQRSFSDQMVAAAGRAAPERTDAALIDWVRPRRDRARPFSTLNADELPTLMADAARAKRFFEGKIVIVGAGLRDMTDYHVTPLNTPTGGKTVGAEMVAQMTAQRLDGRVLRDFPLPAVIAAMALAAFFGALKGLYVGPSFVDYVISIGLFLAIDVSLFAFLSIVTPVGAMVASWTLAGAISQNIATRAERGAA